MGWCDNCVVSPKESREPIRYDPDFNGPIHNRSCTDIIWLIIFILFLGGWGYVGYYSIKHGNVENLLAPIDTEGRRCGLDAGLENRRNLLFFNIVKCLAPGTPITGCATRQVCVSQCPSETILFEKDIKTNPSSFNTLRSKMVCTYDIDVQTLTADKALEYIEQDKCASFIIPSQPVLGRCFPNATEVIKVAEELYEAAEGALNSTGVSAKLARLLNLQQLSAQIVQDLVQSRWFMAGALVAVVIVCFIYILLLRYVITPVVWSSIAGLFALLGFCIYMSYKQYEHFKANPVGLYQTTNLKGYVQSIFSKHETWMVILIALAVFFVILLLVIVFLRSRITIAIALIREGSKAVTSIKSTVIFPIFPWLLQCAVIAYGVLVLMYLLSIGDSTFRIVNIRNDTSCTCNGVYTEEGQSCNPATFIEKCHDTSNTLKPCSLATCHFTGIENPTSVNLMLFVNLLGFFWLMFFISGVADMMLASTFSTWYWTFRKKDLPFFTLTSGIYRTVRYHLGTVAFGALIIAIVRVIRVILEYIDRKVKKFDNPFTRAIMCCCKCFFWCLESFLKFINKNAYIMCAIHGKNFCRSASDAFSLLMRNIVRVVVLDKVADFLFFLSKLLISIGVGVAVYYLLQWNYVYEITEGQRLHYNYVPAIILGIATYLICTIFFNVYSMAVDTLFLCFLEDCERNDGSPEKPYFMSKNLMKILGKRNSKPIAHSK
ncbi:choline transporter-like 2 isoform X3 [Aricia agestis]|uniref:choline transporter-like 2 isoform X3 n=1 Tax=Aricia agestis TaxID=91739 RepID=UPI001C205AEF|nr:choline transporter-like 2 isoform X3 [Aricia agestis]